jgi:hypothetical protein
VIGVALLAARVQNHYVVAARKLMGGMLAVAAGAARHAVWYLRYQVEGQTRDGEHDRRDASGQTGE